MKKTIPLILFAMLVGVAFTACNHPDNPNPNGHEGTQIYQPVVMPEE